MERIDKYLLITVCLSVFLLSACRSTKRGAETANNAVITDICSTQALLPGDSCMSGKLRLTVDVDGKSLSTTGTVKMVRGNGIQLGFTALGLFEVARFEFFPNEALLINKFNREYSSLGYNDIPFLGYAGLDYSMFEALLLNEPFVSGGGSFQESLAYMNIVKEGKLYVITTPEKRGLQYTFFIDTETGELKQTRAIYNKAVTVDCVYSAFEKIGKHSFPHDINISVDGVGNAVNVNIKYSNLRSTLFSLKKSDVAEYRKMNISQMLERLNM
ncbi:MAG: DUF4292 domain-containing protein [Bacteroidaceae bacterium]|nr:DUF4292 domain-containing protein [Bacteroidaceae bacterium]